MFLKDIIKLQKFNVKNTIGADLSLIESKILKCTYEKVFKENYDYLSNVIEPTFPDGMDSKYSNFKLLKEKFQKISLWKKYVQPDFKIQKNIRFIIIN